VLLLAEIPSKLKPISLLPKNERNVVDNVEERPMSGLGLHVSRHILAPSHLNNAVNGPGIVACEAEDKKRAKYADLAPSFCFMLVAVETLGALGAGAVELLDELGRRITKSTGERRATEYLLQRLSVAIQRGNAASVLGTVGLESADTQKLDAVFYL